MANSTFPIAALSNDNVFTNAIPVFTDETGAFVQPTPATIDPVTGNIVTPGTTTFEGLAISNSAPGANVTLSVTNTSSAASSGALISANVTGGSSGDAYYIAQIGSGQAWSWGLDTSVGDGYALAASNALGTSNVMAFTPAGVGTFTGGNLTLATAGTGLVLPVTTASGAAASPLVCNGRQFAATFTTVSIAAGATLALTVSNSAVTGSGTVIDYSWSGATAGSALSIVSIVNSASSSVVTFTNGTGATTSTADIVLVGTVLN